MLAAAVTVELVSTALGGAMVLFLISWLLVRIVPAYREKMLGPALAFLLTLLVVWLLWWAALRSGQLRRFWALLAIGWTLNWAGNLVWAIYAFRIGPAVPMLSWIDGLYLARYVVLFAALSGTPVRMPNWQLHSRVAVALLAVGITSLGLHRQALPKTGKQLANVIGGALYPVLDTMLVWEAVLLWVVLLPGTHRNAVLFLVLAMAAYGVANWVNFKARRASLEVLTSSAHGFWVLSDVLVGLAALSGL